MPNVGSILELAPGTYANDIPVERSGTITTFTNNTITLDPGASSTSNYYVGYFVYIDGNAGYDPKISAYDPVTKVATITGWYVSDPLANNWSSGTPTIGGTWKLVDRYPVQKRHQWIKNGVDIPGAIGLSYTPSTAGNYQVRETAFFVNSQLVEQDRSVTLTPAVSITGSRDPALVYWDNLEYLGCFTTPDYDAGNNDIFAYGGPIAFNPAGNNGQGSLFVRGHVYQNRVGEISIPPQNTWATNSSATVPKGTLLSAQTYDPLEGQLNTSGITSGGGILIGGLHVYNNKLIITAHGDYSSGNSAAWFWQRPLDLSITGQLQGPFSVSDRLTSDTYPRNNQRCFAGYMASVPAELQTKLGGTVICGLSAQSIVSNTSDGPAIAGLNPADFDTAAARRGTVTAASQTLLTLDLAASSNINFYRNWAALCTNGPGTSRTGTGRITDYDPITKIATITGWSTAPVAGDTWIIIPPIAAKAMSMYATGQLQDGTATSYNGISFSGYQGIFNWTARRIGGTVVPNGTRSVLVFGKAGNGPYKYTISSQASGGYKYFSNTLNTDTPGEKAYPYYNRCWAYDVNELEQARLGNILPGNVKPYAVMNFVFPFAGSQNTSDINGVTYDPSTSRIFLTTFGLPYGNLAIHVYRVTNATDSTGGIVIPPVIPPTIPGDAPAILTTNLPSVPAYQSFSFPIQADGSLPMTWEVVGGNLEVPMNWKSGGLPSNVVFDKYMAYLRSVGGTPSVGSFSFTIKATNDYGSDQRTLTLTTTDPGSGPPVIKTTILPNVRTTTYLAVPGRNDYNYNNGGNGSTRIVTRGSIVGMTWSIVSGSLPPGLTFDNSTGVISGRATSAGTYNFTVRATNNIGSVEQALSISAVDVTNISGNNSDGIPVIANRKLPDMVVNSLVIAHGIMYSEGGTAPITWSIIGGTQNGNNWSGGGLPAGIVLNATSGVISGQVASSVTPGEYFFTVQASNSFGTDRVLMSTAINPDPTALPELIMQPMIATYQGPGT